MGRHAPNSQVTKGPLQSITAQRPYDASRESQAVLWGGTSLCVLTVGGGGRQGRGVQAKRERRLDRTTWHFQQFGLHPKVIRSHWTALKGSDLVRITPVKWRRLTTVCWTRIGRAGAGLGSRGSESRQYLYFPATLTNQGWKQNCWVTCSPKSLIQRFFFLTWKKKWLPLNERDGEFPVSTVVRTGVSYIPEWGTRIPQAICLLN